MVHLFEKYKELVILITPETTRAYNPNRKKGFYYIAQGAQVPIVLGYLDYQKKHAGLGPVIIESGNVERDIKQIKKFYSRIHAKHPEGGVK